MSKEDIINDHNKRMRKMFDSHHKRMSDIIIEHDKKIEGIYGKYRKQSRNIFYQSVGVFLFVYILLSILSEIFL